jgi:hypothetical protein
MHKHIGILLVTPTVLMMEGLGDDFPNIFEKNEEV